MFTPSIRIYYSACTTYTVDCAWSFLTAYDSTCYIHVLLLSYTVFRTKDHQNQVLIQKLQARKLEKKQDKERELKQQQPPSKTYRPGNAKSWVTVLTLAVVYHNYNTDLITMVFPNHIDLCPQYLWTCCIQFDTNDLLRYSTPNCLLYHVHDNKMI